MPLSRRKLIKSGSSNKKSVRIDSMEKEWSEGDLIVHLPTKTLYEFGYRSCAEGKVVLYVAGECNMQDSVVVKAEDCIKVTNRK